MVPRWGGDPRLTPPWGCGKTVLLLAGCGAAIKGEGFLDSEIALPPAKSLFIQTDAGASRFRAAFEELGMAADPRFCKGPEQMLHVIASDEHQGTSGFKATLPGLIQLEQWVKDIGVRLIVIDSVKGMLSGTGIDYTNNEQVESVRRSPEGEHRSAVQLRGGPAEPQGHRHA